MTTEQMQVRQWMMAGQQDCPRCPSEVDQPTSILRIKLIHEELVELTMALGLDSIDYGLTFIKAKNTNLNATADALADLLVVLLGTAVACGIDLDPCFQEVMRSNNTKFVKDGNGNLTVVKNHLGKIMKPSTYEPPNLVPIIQHQIENPLH